jgi:hypothetical protein
VLCDGEGSGYAAGLGMGSGDARLEALRFACPDLSFANMLEPEGAITAVYDAARPLSRCFCAVARWDWPPVWAGSRAGIVPLSEAMHQSTPSPGGVKLDTALLGLSDDDWESS